MKRGADLFDKLGQLIDRADALIGMGRMREATQELQRALVLDPQDENIHALVAYIYGTFGELDVAFEHCAEAIRVNPECGYAYYVYAKLLLLKEQKSDIQYCVDIAKLAVKYDPNHYLAYSTLIEAYVWQGDLSEAEKVASQFLRKFPEYDIAHRALAILKIKQEEWADAEMHCRRAMAINPNVVLNFCHLSVSLFKQGRQKQARKMLLRAARLEPNHEFLLKTMRELFPDLVIA